MTSKGSEKLVFHLDPDAVDAIPLGVTRCDPEGRIGYANRAVQELMGPGLGIGTRLQDFEFTPDSQGVVEANLQQRFEEERATGYTVSIVHPDRTRVHAEISGIPEYDGAGKLVGAIGFVTDKTMDRGTWPSTARSARHRTRASCCKHSTKHCGMRLRSTRSRSTSSAPTAARCVSATSSRSARRASCQPGNGGRCRPSCAQISTPP